jgi:hypothetical protein
LFRRHAKIRSLRSLSHRVAISTLFRRHAKIRSLRSLSFR